MTEQNAVGAIEAFREKFESNLHAIKLITSRGVLPDLVTAMGLPSYDGDD